MTNVRPSVHELLHDIKAYRELCRKARQGKDAAERAYREAGITSSLPYGTTLELDPYRFLLQTVQAMNDDKTFQYETVAPYYDEGTYVVSTANVNEYQARFYGPLPHEEMRKVFRDFSDAIEDPANVRMFRSNFFYEPEDTSSCTGLRAAFSIAWLENQKEESA